MLDLDTIYGLLKSDIFRPDYCRHVAFRRCRNLALQALYFLSPVLYSRDRLPSELVSWLVYNPMFNQIESIRTIFYDGVLPDPGIYFTNLGVSLLVLFAGLFIFKRSEDKFLYFL